MIKPFLRVSVFIALLIQFSLSVHAENVALDTLSLKEILQQSGQPHAHQSASGHPLKVSQKVYPQGIGSRAHSIWVLELDSQAITFTGAVGVDDQGGGAPTLQFLVEGDGRMLWKSSFHTIGDPAENFSVDLTGIKQIKLWITSRGDSAHSDADWLNPIIAYHGSKPRPIVTTWAQNIGPKQAFWGWSKIPPMGWNTYQAFGASVTEDEIMANADYMVKHLLPYGWNTLVVDYRWSDADAAKHNRNGNGGPLVADSYGRLLPAPNRFPSAADGHGFKALAAKIHAMGLKFGIHVMRGIPRQSVKLNTPIEGSTFHAAEAANLKSTCGWCGDMWGIDGTQPAGQAYYDSVFRLYASWDIDFVKVDDISYPYSAAEIACVREAIDKTGRPMILSLSCGETPVSQFSHVARHANMWRVSSDFWDQWRALNHSFDLAEAWKGVGGPGHWPDFDMIPFGHLGIRCFDGESSPRNRWTRFTHEEQITLMTLWCLQASPLMLGGNLPDLDDWTLNVLTNQDALAIDQDPLGKPAECRLKSNSGTSVWLRDLTDGSKAIGLFNRGNQPASISLKGKDIGLTGKYAMHDIWQKKDFEYVEGKPSTWSIPSHGSVFLKLQPIIP